jgi:hypothetical protein
VVILGAVAWAAFAGASGCATTSARNPSLIPTRTRVDAGPFAIYTNSALDSSSPVALQLLALRDELHTELGLADDPSHRPIEVYILDDRSTFRHFLTFYYPELPPRRAFFFAQGDRRVVYAYQGERLEEDLRHEASHALLNQSVADLPLWLDEGLAEYFEAGGDRGGANAEHLRHLPRDLEEGWRPDLARLELLDDVRAMTPRDYREAWAWVHYFLQSSPSTRSELTGFLSDLRTGRDAEPLSSRFARLQGTSPESLIAHVKDLGSAEIASSRQEKRPVVRMQSRRDPGPERPRPPLLRWIDPAEATAQRLLSRIAQGLGRTRR